ncbi:Zn-dependent hydrolase [Roseomonas fluvialis]|uniref:Zn-dependent hydrolase n=1 Tax=Roseomonas fluvialis TaxID=1750527 RepID=A0ABM7Y4J6_9PROT|nr:Zn-dependent hydrolase [Roseomonas fluvialis]BDG72783.1 Zn-dependent hydrolase [Roseomonas fluvialis]
MSIAFDPDRLWNSLEEMARIGATPQGGVKRLALSPEDGQARALLRDWAQAAGCTVTVDRLGSMYCTYAGTDAKAAPVAVGSHLDSVPTGGKYDGPYGVLLGLEILRALHQAGRRTRAPITVVNWTNEEGSRFSPAMSASGGAMGVLDEAKVLAAPDNFDASITYADALAAIGWAGDADPARARDFAAYFEAHIEQGPILEREGIPIGIVTHCIGVEQWDVVVTGTDGHVGYPMAGRRDALAAASELVLALERIAIETGGMATATRITLAPDARGNIPAMVRLAANIRHPDADGNARMEAAFRAAMADLATRRGVEVQIIRVGGYPRVPFAAPLLDALRRGAQGAQLKHRDMPGPIPQDALHVGIVVPSALMFIPCHGGVSHHPSESISRAWCAAGLAAMGAAVIEAAGGLA